MFTIILKENDNKIYVAHGNSITKVLYTMLAFIKTKYGEIIK
jgi:hypothetical protein